MYVSTAMEMALIESRGEQQGETATVKSGELTKGETRGGGKRRHEGRWRSRIVSERGRVQRDLREEGVWRGGEEATG